ncbi:hypothetical protein H1R20_g14564, partial [Candolleomyces eurysporus]
MAEVLAAQRRVLSKVKLREHIAAGALHDSAERCDAPKCHPDTRVAVQEEVVSWIFHGGNDGEPKMILWVTGPAGSGKTAIMGSVADTCQGKGTLSATFFFSSFSGSADRRSKRCFVPTLAYQLVQHDALGQVGEQILSTVERNPAIFEQKLEVQLDQLILEPLRACRNRPQLPEWPKVILIDGLDECEADQYHDRARSDAPLRSNGDDQTEILSVLAKAASDPDFPFRIVIASRPEHAIRSFFTGVARPMTRTLFLDEKYDPDADMKLFLECKFADVRRRYHLPSSWPTNNVARCLVSNASGQFIYVATVVRFIDGPEGHPDQLLKQVLGLPDATISTNPFAPLDALYTHPAGDSDSHLKIHWLNLIFRERYLDRTHTSLPRPLYERVKLARESTRAPALFVRLFLDSYPGEASYVFKNLNSLVSIPPMDDARSPYGLYHRSLVDFLGESSRSGNLHVKSDMVLEFFIDRYTQIWKSKGPERSLTPPEKTVFLSNFFSRSLVANIFSAQNLNRLDEAIQSCDIAWWVQSFEAKEDGGKSTKSFLHLKLVFCDVHKTVSVPVQVYHPLQTCLP